MGTQLRNALTLFGALGMIYLLTAEISGRRKREGEFAALTARVATLEEELARVRRESPAGGPSDRSGVRALAEAMQLVRGTAEQGAARQPTEAEDDRPLREQLADREDEGALHTEELDARAAQEPADPAWAPRAQQSLLESTRQAFPTFAAAAFDARCGSSLCTVDVTFENPDQVAEAAATLARSVPWKGETLLEIHPDQKRARYYVAREAQRLFDGAP